MHRSIRTTEIATGLLPLLLCGALSCSDAVGAPRDLPECVRATVEQLSLREDPSCAVAASPLAALRLPDLAFTPGACFTTGEVDVALTLPDGRVLAARITAYSGISRNPIAGAALAPLPVPLLAPDGSSHVYVPFSAASTIELRSVDGVLVGELVTRDTGFSEIRAGSVLPAYVSERLVIVGGRGALDDVVGELFATGDEFGGVPVAGSICGAALGEALARAL